MLLRSSGARVAGGGAGGEGAGAACSVAIVAVPVLPFFVAGPLTGGFAATGFAFVAESGARVVGIADAAGASADEGGAALAIGGSSLRPSGSAAEGGGGAAVVAAVVGLAGPSFALACFT